jgi:hypothetical protein
MLFEGGTGFVNCFKMSDLIIKDRNGTVVGNFDLSESAVLREDELLRARPRQQNVISDLGQFTQNPRDKEAERVLM